MTKEHYYQHTDLGLCLTMTGLIWLGFKKDSLKTASSRGSNAWKFFEHPEDKRMVLVAYDSLSSSYQKNISEKLRVRMACKCDDSFTCKCGDIYNYTAQQPILKMIVKDSKAEAFYLGYRYEGTTGIESISAERVKHYTNEASILNMLLHATTNAKEVIKNGLQLSLDQFWNHAKNLVEIEKSKANISNKFPTSYRFLTEKLREYSKGGYASLIHGNMGKANAAKISDDLSKAYLLALISDPLQYDDWTVMLMYNNWAKEKGYQLLLAEETIGVHRRKNYNQIITSREGKKAFHERFNKQISGFKPTAPLYLVENDDNHLDLLFTDWNDDSTKRHYHRFKAMVVTDSFNRLPLGKMYAENLSKDLVRAAYVDAMYYIRSLTGGWYLPHETKSDNWGVAELEPFYKSIGHYHRTPVGSKQRGYIEQSFGDAHWKRCIKLSSSGNYTGNNVTAKNRGVNIEWVADNKKNYPAIQESTERIEAFFYLLRHFPQTNGKSREQEWLEKWNETPEADKRPITDEQFLFIFGIEHNPHGRHNTIDAAGISFQVNNQYRQYTLPEEVRFNNVGKSVTIIYDPMDFSRILISDGDKLRSIATETRLQSRAIKDYLPGDRTYLNALLQEKKDNVKKVSDKQAKRKQVLLDNGIDSDTFFQVGMMVKEMKLDAETKVLMNNNNEPKNDTYDAWEQA